MFLKLEELTVEQKIGMVLCARRFREDDLEFILELVKKRALGCIQAPFQKPEITKAVKEAADYPIIIVNDTERGYPTSELPKIPLVALAATGKKEYFQAFAKAVVRDAQADNCNGTWGPVIDILHQDGPITVPRRLSDDPQKVGEIAEEIARIYGYNNIPSTQIHADTTQGGYTPAQAFEISVENALVLAVLCEITHTNKLEFFANLRIFK